MTWASQEPPVPRIGAPTTEGSPGAMIATTEGAAKAHRWLQWRFPELSERLASYPLPPWLASGLTRLQ
jgi:hypothetical protein